jgi:formamidopyrimidine-DNA glycosylase
MPELPEVETIRRTLQKAIVGKKIKDVEIRLPKVFHGDKGEILGKTIEGIERRGKILIIRLSGDKTLLIHFKLTGQLVFVEHGAWNMEHRITLRHPIPFAGTELPAKTTHVIFEIDGGRLFYNDLRQFGWIKVADRGEGLAVRELEKLGPEPFSQEFNKKYLEEIFAKTSKPIKLVLMDQEKIAGIGNIYANEALFEAGIDPRKPAKQLDNKAIEQLRQSILQVLEDGLKYGGSSAADEAYIKPTGEPGSYQEHFRVYQQEGQKCPKCGTVIKRIDLGGRGTFFCPRCQK